MWFLHFFFDVWTPTTASGVLDNFTSRRLNGMGVVAPPDQHTGYLFSFIDGEDIGQSDYMKGDGLYRDNAAPNIGCDLVSLRGCGTYWRFDPRTGAGDFWPGTYFQDYKVSGTWSPGVNRLKLTYACDKNVAFYGHSVEIGTYSRYKAMNNTTQGGTGYEGQHYYHHLPLGAWVGKWTTVTLNAQPSHRVGVEHQTPEFDPEWNATTNDIPVHYWDGMTRWYWDTQGKGDDRWAGVRCAWQPPTYDTVFAEPDAFVFSTTITHDGSNYQVGFASASNIPGGTTYHVVYSTSDLKVNGFFSGISGGTGGGTLVAADNADDTWLQWTSPALAQSSHFYVGIRPDMNVQTYITGNPAKLYFYKAHGLSTGDIVNVVGVDSSVNGNRTVTVVDYRTVSLGVTGSGSMSGNGTATAISNFSNFTQLVLDQQSDWVPGCEIVPSWLTATTWLDGQTVSATLSAYNCGAGTKTWTSSNLNNGTSNGLSGCNSVTGNSCVISGTLNNGGGSLIFYAPTISVTDGGSNAYSIKTRIVTKNSGCILSPTTMGPFTNGASVSQVFTPTNCASSTCSVQAETSLPAGWSLGGSQNCTLTGTAATGLYNFTIVYDTNANPLQVVVNSTGTCTILPTSIGPYVNGQVVSQTFTPMSCSTSTCSVSSGSLTGSGLSLGGTQNCVLGGTATTGVYSVSISYDTATNPYNFSITPIGSGGTTVRGNTFPAGNVIRH